ncbi:MAG: sigma-70 family RNA polymerase sigma factor [Eubacteriales bacterium]|nr:sigma-70 family RNA polymerase sigma factor [Eubacteriales bacterium]
MSANNLVMDSICKAQSGDGTVREQLISENLPFIRRTVRRLTRSFFVDQMDEYSIALSAFDEAIDRYRLSSQVPFEHYARVLIKHRLTDWYRRQKNSWQTLSLEETGSEEDVPLSEKLADPGSGQVQTDLEFEESMLQLQAMAAHLGLDFPVLVRDFPKHRDTRLLCIRLARCLNEDEALCTRLFQTGRLPGGELASRCQVARKTVDRNRSAVILLVLLLRSDLQIIKSYMERYSKEEEL